MVNWDRAEPHLITGEHWAGQYGNAAMRKGGGGPLRSEAAARPGVSAPVFILLLQPNTPTITTSTYCCIGKIECSGLYHCHCPCSRCCCHVRPGLLSFPQTVLIVAIPTAQSSVLQTTFGPRIVAFRTARATMPALPCSPPSRCFPVEFAAG